MCVYINIFIVKGGHWNTTSDTLRCHLLQPSFASLQLTYRYNDRKLSNICE